MKVDKKEKKAKKAKAADVILSDGGSKEKGVKKAKKTKDKKSKEASNETKHEGDSINGDGSKPSLKRKKRKADADPVVENGKAKKSKNQDSKAEKKKRKINKESNDSCENEQQDILSMKSAKTKAEKGKKKKTDAESSKKDKVKSDKLANGNESKAEEKSTQEKSKKSKKEKKETKSKKKKSKAEKEDDVDTGQKPATDQSVPLPPPPAVSLPPVIQPNQDNDQNNVDQSEYAQENGVAYGQGQQQDHKRGSAANAFRRVKAEEWMHDKHATDNSYTGTFGDSGWGYKAWQVLSTVRGKDFRHEKTKKKRGSYKGGSIDAGAINAIQYNSDDD